MCGQYDRHLFERAGNGSAPPTGVVLRNGAIVLDPLLGQEIRGVGLLEQGIPHVLLVPQHRGFDTMCAVGAS